MTFLSAKTEIRLKTNSFYGWYALIGAMISMVITGGVFMVSFAVLFPEICSHLNWSRTMVSGALSVGIITIGLLSPVYGKLVYRFGPRKMIIVGNCIAAAGFASLYLVEKSWQFYVLYALSGIGCGLGTMIACTTVANNWFIKKNALAMGLLTASPGLGGFIIPPITTAFLGVLGWQATYLALAVLVVLGPVLLSGLILVKDRPADMGQMPDGDATRPLVASSGAMDRRTTPSSIHATNPLRQRMLWMIIAFVTFYSVVFGAVSTHHVAFARDIGLSPMAAAATLSTLSAFLIFGSVGFGFLALQFNIRYLAASGFFLQFLAIAIILFKPSLSLMFAYAVCIGAGVGILNAAMPTFLGTYYPRQRFAQVMGFVLPFHIMSQALSTTAFGAIYDRTASYNAGFALLLIFIVLGLLSLFAVCKPE